MADEVMAAAREAAGRAHEALAPLLAAAQAEAAPWVERMRPLFVNPEAALPARWRPTGDWVADARTAFEAAFDGSQVSQHNATHFAFKNTHWKGKTQTCYFENTHQLVPELETAGLYPFGDLENRFDGAPLSMYMATYYWMPLLAVTLYVALVFGGRLFMSCLPAAGLKWPLFLWNLALSAFSWVGVVRTVPHLFGELQRHGLYYSMCTPVCQTFGAGSIGLWCWLFIISKFPELIDTAFIVLRKKPLIFLHWYHHVTVLLYCWQSYTTQNSAGIYFICMNFSVHAIMYGYYALKAVGLWPRFIPSWTITILQLLQMIGGIAVCLLTYKYKNVDKLPCSISDASFETGVLMYASYFLLFLQILFKLLSGGAKRKPKRKTE